MHAHWWKLYFVDWPYQVAIMTHVQHGGPCPSNQRAAAAALVSNIVVYSSGSTEWSHRRPEALASHIKWVHPWQDESEMYSSIWCVKLETARYLISLFWRLSQQNNVFLPSDASNAVWRRPPQTPLSERIRTYARQCLLKSHHQPTIRRKQWLVGYLEIARIFWAHRDRACTRTKKSNLRSKSPCFCK